VDGADRRPTASTIGVLATLVLALAPAGLADGQPTAAAAPDTEWIVCDAELQGYPRGWFEQWAGLSFTYFEGPVHLVQPGQTISCTARHLVPDLEAGWAIRHFTPTAEDLFQGTALDRWQPGDAGRLMPEEDRSVMLSSTLGRDLRFGWFEGSVWQWVDFDSEGDPEEEPHYAVEFGGVVLGAFDLLREGLTCDPEPAALGGGEVRCLADELSPGGFDWEVRVLSVPDLVKTFMRASDVRDQLVPAASGSGRAGEDGSGAFAFALPAGGDGQVYLAIAEQADHLAVYVGEVGPAAPPAPAAEDGGAGSGAGGTPPPVQVPRPSRVDTGAGGATAPGGGVLALALVLGLALTVTFSLGRAAHRDR
jgi:hypothetical protein